MPLRYYELEGKGRVLPVHRQGCNLRACRGDICRRDDKFPAGRWGYQRTYQHPTALKLAMTSAGNAVVGGADLGKTARSLYETIVQHMTEYGMELQLEREALGAPPTRQKSTGEFGFDPATRKGYLAKIIAKGLLIGRLNAETER